jgi:hypothetical protein
VFLAGLFGCHDARQGPCEEEIEKPSFIVGTGSFPPPRPDETPNAKLVHLVTFSMGPVVETLEGYMIVRAPDAFRLYGMTESGQRAFDVAWLSSAGGERVTRIYCAPFLKDERILDQIARATARTFLLRARPWGVPAAKALATPTEERIERDGVTFFYGGAGGHLRWLEAETFSACYMDWTLHGDFFVPERIHYRSTEGPYPWTLTMKLIRAEALEKPPPDSLFAPK